MLPRKRKRNRDTTHPGFPQPCYVCTLHCNESIEIFKTADSFHHFQKTIPCFDFLKLCSAPLKCHDSNPQLLLTVLDDGGPCDGSVITLQCRKHLNGWRDVISGRLVVFWRLMHN